MALPDDLVELLRKHGAAHLRTEHLSSVPGGEMHWYMIKDDMLLAHKYGTSAGVALYVSPPEPWEETLAKLAE